MKKMFFNLPKTIRQLIVAVLYSILAVASLSYSYQFSNATPIWPPSGFAFAILLLGGIRLAPGIFIGAFSANLFVFITNNTCPPLTASWASLIIAAGNTAEALTGFYLLQKLTSNNNSEVIFKTVHSVLRFAVTSLIMCLTSCTVGATAILLTGVIAPADYFTVWFTWWTGDISGILLFTPFIVLCIKEWRLLFSPMRRIVETLFLITGLAAASMLVFFGWFNPPFLFTRAFFILPFLIWASVRLNRTLLTVLLIISSAIAVIGTISGVGPFIGPTMNESLLTVETFVSINAVMVLVLNAAISEREEKELRLQEAKFNLEGIVHRRTKQLEEKNRELEARSKELASFTYAASHDLQEPLRKIQTFSDKILQTPPELQQGHQDLFRRIQSAVIRMKLLIENLLSYSLVQVSRPTLQLTDLNEIVQEVKNDLSEAIQNSGVIIECCELPKLDTVPFQMQQLFTNIIGNAIKFRKQGITPRISIVCGLANKNNIPTPDAATVKDYYHLIISDNGIGFEPQYSEKIFDIFQRLHGQNEYGGTGIGLAICKKIVETHKGFITATAELGKGSSFHIFFPLHEKAASVAFKKEEPVNTSFDD